MTCLYVTHDIFVHHDTGPGHPECAARLAGVSRALAGPRFADMRRKQARKASVEDLLRIHEANYIRDVFASIPQCGRVRLDPDTVLSPQSGTCALFAVGAVLDGIDAVLTTDTRCVFCAVRPPGHHAEANRAMGFCVFNGVAVGALYGLEHDDVERVAIIDFDVHHGNGTEAAVRKNPALFYASSHQSPAYPGTGRAGDHGPLGNILNVELSPGSGGGAFRAAYRDAILPAVAAFSPDLILVSAGFDGHVRDPLAALELTEEDYAWLGEGIRELGERACSGKIVSVLEGGYDFQALGDSLAAYVGALAGVGF